MMRIKALPDKNTKQYRYRSTGGCSKLKVRKHTRTGENGLNIRKNASPK